MTGFNATRRGYLGLSAGAVAASALPVKAAAETPAAPPLTLVAADRRDLSDLSGQWRWSVDPYRDGAEGFHGAEAGLGHRRYDEVNVEQVMRANPRVLYEYDMDQAPESPLPGAWLAAEPELRHYQGLMWYRRGVETTRGSGRTFIRVGAAEYQTGVWFNGTHLGDHEGGFTPFAFEVTHLIKDGLNHVTLGVDSLHKDDSVPPPITDWETYGGVTRAVTLVRTAHTFIDDAWIRLDKQGRVAVTVHLNGPAAANAAVRVDIKALNLALNGQTDAAGRWTATAPAPRRLQRWSPERPTLYDVAFTAGEDRLTDRIGFRTLEVRGEDILLNGQSVFLRGICLHEEEIGANPARIITEETARALLVEAKEGLNCNFVRLAHYPHSEVMTRLCDELGLIVWSEIPVYWRVAFDNPKSLATARNMLAENIRRDRNRCSIALWSVGNETPVSPPRNAFLRALIADVRALDDSRLVTAALLFGRSDVDGVPTQHADDPLAADLDVMAVNTYNGWYSEDPLSRLPDIRWTSEIHKPLIFSEFGADAKIGFHDTETMRKFSEEFQAEYFRQTLAMADRIPFLRGLSPWILKDFRSPRRQHPVFQQGWNRKGLISETGERKQAFAVLADHYRRKARA
ncbi:beta-glucuronidase [Brevundimonas sp. Leaf363]|uniref:glycoside hydrolase family 2 protein n=1 Tax=Brevundimonas sp. Leaf363 TaxID=1736353 RepID=UPI0006F9625C|nr:glycoside hydrolase family 2 TIM barrel-domain containing protein [Brevundimonas sp. Leaf363]KQS55803.1 beta-glucuronidase [Brevundimonas sp. Leaf363]